jgi:hypothetical protein
LLPVLLSFAGVVAIRCHDQFPVLRRNRT